MRYKIPCIAAIAVASAACSGKQREFGDVSGSAGVGNSEGVNAKANTTPPPSGPAAADAVNVPQPNEGAVVPAEGVEPAVNGETKIGGSKPVCADDGGSCAPVDAGPARGCVPTGARDCTSPLDNDCDGRPDDTLDDVCVCAPQSIEPCDAHPGLDGRGPCRAGSRSCIAGEGNATSSWGACEGSIGPGAQDSCVTEGDDANCDGTVNGGCPCVDGETRACGPDTENGICQRGTQTCANLTFGACVGAVFPLQRNCQSSEDNDCDGRPDDTVDNVCTCTVGTTQVCGSHPGQDGFGQCRAGQRRCDPGPNNASSGFGGCVGSVGPALQDSCTTLGDDANCNAEENDGCDCIAGQGNGPCSDTPATARCNAQGQCAPCLTNADCLLVPGGRSSCEAGVCVSPPNLPGAGAPCGPGDVCAANLQCAPNGICCQSACDGICESCAEGTGVCEQLDTSPACPALTCNTGVPPRCSSFPPNSAGQCAGRDACLSAQDYCEPRPLPIGSACLSAAGNPGKCQGVDDCDELEIQCATGATPVFECDIEEACCFGLLGPQCNAGTSCLTSPFGFTDLRVGCDEPSDCGVNEICCVDDLSGAAPLIACRPAAQCVAPRTPLCGSPVATSPCPAAAPRCLSIASGVPNWSYCLP